MLISQKCANCYFRETSPQTLNDGSRYFCENPATKEMTPPIFEVSREATGCSEFLPLPSLARVDREGKYIPPPRWGEMQHIVAHQATSKKGALTENKLMKTVLVIGSVITIVCLEIQHTWPEIVATIHTVFGSGKVVH